MDVWERRDLSQWWLKVVTSPLNKEQWSGQQLTREGRNNGMGGSLEGEKETGYKKKKKLKKQRYDIFLGEEEKLEKRKKKRGSKGLTGEGRVREVFQQVRVRVGIREKVGKGKGFQRKRKQSLEEHFQVDDVLELKLKGQLQVDMDKGTCPP